MHVHMCTPALPAHACSLTRGPQFNWDGNAQAGWDPNTMPGAIGYVSGSYEPQLGDPNGASGLYAEGTQTALQLRLDRAFSDIAGARKHMMQVMPCYSTWAIPGRQPRQAAARS